MGPFSVRTVVRDGESLVTVHGDVDLATAARFQEELALAVADGFPVAVDCSAVAFIDSMGLRALLHAMEKAEAEGVRLRLAAWSPPLARILDLAGLAEVFFPEGAETALWEE